MTTPIDPALVAHDGSAWDQLERGLIDALFCLDEGEALIVSTHSGAAGDTGAVPYVQFAGYGHGYVRGEVSSNHFLHERYKLSGAHCLALENAGYTSPPLDLQDPRAKQEGPNFWINAGPDQIPALARASVFALRDILAVPHPSSLVAGGPEGEQTLAVACLALRDQVRTIAADKRTDETRSEVLSWNPSPRYRLFWVLPQGFDWERLRNRTLVALDALKDLQSTVTTLKRDAVEESRLERKKCHFMDPRDAPESDPDLAADHQDDWIATADREASSRIRSYRSRIRKYRSMIADAEEKFEPLRRAQLEFERQGEHLQARERTIREDVKTASQIQQHACEIDESATALYERLCEAHRVLCIQLRLDNRPDLADLLGAPLRKVRSTDS